MDKLIFIIEKVIFEVKELLKQPSKTDGLLKFFLKVRGTVVFLFFIHNYFYYKATGYSIVNI